MKPITESKQGEWRIKGTAVMMPDGFRWRQDMPKGAAPEAWEEIEARRMRNAEFIVRSVNSHQMLVDALAQMTEHYVSLINSGDAGNWNPEEEPEVIKAREALKKALP